MSESRAMYRLNAIKQTVWPGQTTAARSSVQAETCASFFDDVSVPPPDAIFHTKAMHAADKSPQKINLGVGAYRTNEGKPYVLNVVRKAMIAIANDTKLNREYLPMTGDAAFCKAAAELLFGKQSPALAQGRVASSQSLSGTGALRLAGEFIHKFLPSGTTIYISDPTWGNHKTVFKAAGVPIKTYRYWDAKARNLDFDGMIADMRAAPKGSVMLLHVAAHNPTGVDPTQAQWRAIAAVMEERGHFPFFDCAYQGFASGDLEQDGYPPRHFVERGFEMLVCQSFAKNIGLYNARIGAIHFVTNNASKTPAVRQQIAKIVRPMYSNPPADGARIVKLILTDPILRPEWEAEVKGMAHRILDMRALLRKTLEALATPGDWSHITTQIGMFTYTGLSLAQCKALKETHHVYLLDSGRISMAGVNSSNVEYLAKAFNAVVRNN